MQVMWVTMVAINMMRNSIVTSGTGDAGNSLPGVPDRPLYNKMGSFVSIYLSFKASS